MAPTSRTVCFLAVAFLATVVFQTHQVYTQTQGQTNATCKDFTNQSDCCTSNDSCFWCAQNDSSVDGVCGGDACGAGLQNLCQPQPVDNCNSFTAQDACCKANCSFCQVTGQSNGTCSSQCNEQANDTCAEPIITTSPATPTTTPVPACNTLNETSCCGTSGRCSLCVPTGGGAGACKDNNTCTETEADACAATPTAAPPTNSSTTSTPTPTQTPTAAPSGGGGRGQHFDAASFIGGIILCAGIFAIVYFGCKFYKARKDQNYHTL